MRLRDLDARLVPRLAVLLRAALDTSTERAHVLARAARRRGTELLASGRSLQRLDDRFAARGPLKLLRDVPQLGLLVVGALFLAGAGAAVALSGPDAVLVQEQAEPEVELPLTLGPAVGEDIEEHFAQARERALELAERDPDERHLSLVTLNKGLTPEQVVELLGEESDLQVQRAYVRAPLATPTEEIAVDVSGELVRTLRAVLAQTATRKAEEQQEFLSLAASIEPGSPEEEAFRGQYEADARLAAVEAAEYRPDCACVFALVVEGEVGELAELPALSVVRGVQIAPEGAALPALHVRPLAPVEQGVVAEPDGRGA